MLIFPLHKPVTRNNFPVVTATLIALNLAVYFGLQGGDRAIAAEAADYYHESGLEAQEWRWFDDYVGALERPHRQRIERIEALAERDPPDGTLAEARASTVRAHPGFLAAAEQGLFVERDSANWREWRQHRREYEHLLGRSFTQTHMLSLDAFDPPGLLSHLFMHGGIGHLVGNMLFLALLGLLVEGAMGRGLFLVSYLGAGLAAAATFLAAHWGATTGMLGASGAIAGLMGLYTVLYGRRRVRFLYWAFVYFDYIRAPALVLLPIWLGWELFQLGHNGFSNVAYEAHIGGIAAGALIGVGVRALGLQNDDFLDEETRRDADRETLARAEEAISALKPDQAKLKLRPLLQRHPRDPAVLGAWYAACKLRPRDAERTTAARDILALEADRPEVRALVLKVLEDSHQAPRIRLTPELALSLARRLLRWERPGEARRLIDTLLTMRVPPEGTAACCRGLAQALTRDSQTAEARRYTSAAARLATPSTAAKRDGSTARV